MMNNEIFEDKFHSAIPKNEDDIKEAVDKIVDFCDDGWNRKGVNSLFIAMEEMAELSQELSNKIRGNCDKMYLLQELVSVQLSIYSIQKVLCISEEDFDKALSAKIDVLLSCIEQGKHF